jgi:hypothetical protein
MDQLVKYTRNISWFLIIVIVIFVVVVVVVMMVVVVVVVTVIVMGVVILVVIAFFVGLLGNQINEVYGVVLYSLRRLGEFVRS